MTRSSALRNVCRGVATEPFAYGSHDCCQFARRVVTALRGEDPAAHLSYTSAAGAQAIIDAYGGLEGLLSSMLGPPVPVAELDVADVCLLRIGRQELVGVVSGAGRVIAPQPHGLDTIPLRAAVCGWRVIPAEVA